MGENDRQGTAKHTNMSHRLMIHEINSHYEPSFVHGGAVLGQHERFCAHFLVPDEGSFACAFHRKRADGNGQGGVNI